MFVLIHVRGDVAVSEHGIIDRAIIAVVNQDFQAVAQKIGCAGDDAVAGIGNGRVFPAGPLRAPLDTQLGFADAIILIPGIKGTKLVNTNQADHDVIWSGIQSKLEFESIEDLALIGPVNDLYFDDPLNTIIKPGEIEALAYGEFIRDLKTTGRSHNRVMVIEVFGRYAGHTAFRGGVAGEADAILIPEIPVDFEELYRHMYKLFTKRVF